MLNNLVQTAAAFAQNASGTEAAVFNAWVRELQGHRDANSDLIGMTDAEFDQELNEEIKILEAHARRYHRQPRYRCVLERQYWRRYRHLEETALTASLLVTLRILLCSRFRSLPAVQAVRALCKRT